MQRRHSDASGTIDLLALAVGAALLAGVLDLGALQLRRMVVEPLVFVGRHVWWTAPAALLVLFVPIAASIGLAARLAPRLPAWLAAAWLFATLGIFGALYTFPQIQRLAALVLSAGVATAVSRWLARRESVARGWFRRAAPAGLALLTVAAAVSISRDVLRERRSLAALPSARPGTPNVLLIVLDTVRAMSLSLHGYHRPTTPELERWAERGVTFLQAYSTAPWTLPSHASLLTGRWMHELSADWMVPLDDRFPMLSEVLGAAGYRTGGFVANTDYCSAEVGLDRGFGRFEDYTLTPGQVLRSAALWRAVARVEPLRRLIGNYDNLGRKVAPDISRAFLRWAGADNRPFFALLNYYDAHRPYLPPDPWPARFRTPDVPLNTRYRKENGTEPNPTPARIQGAIDAYDGAIAYLDHEIGKLLDALEQQGVLQRTIVVVTSDHGEEFMEHGAWDHGNTLYQAGVHVPLLVIAPGVPAGLRVDAPVSLRDIPATVAGLLDLSDAPFPGRSLARWWSGPEPTVVDSVFTGVRQVPRQPFWYPVARGNLASIRVGPWRYIRNYGDGVEELFDVEGDPMERQDRTPDPGLSDILSGLRLATDTVFPRQP